MSQRDSFLQNLLETASSRILSALPLLATNTQPCPFLSKDSLHPVYLQIYLQITISFFYEDAIFPRRIYESYLIER